MLPSPYQLTYESLYQLLNEARQLYDVRPLEEASPLHRPSTTPRLYLRHDIDLDLRAAVRVAELERGLEIRATYMVMLTSPFYRLEERVSRRLLARLIALGHEVALHLDLDSAAVESDALESRVRDAADSLQQILGSPIRSVSFHRPVPSLIRGPFHVAGLINAYAADLMGRYYSDSRGRWRNGDPLPLLREFREPSVQLLIHPIWWAQQHREPADTLEEFFQTTTSGMAPWDRQFASDALANHLSIQRAGLQAEKSHDATRTVRHGRDSAVSANSIS